MGPIQGLSAATHLVGVTHTDARERKDSGKTLPVRGGKGYRSEAAPPVFFRRADHSPVRRPNLKSFCR